MRTDDSLESNRARACPPVEALLAHLEEDGRDSGVVASHLQSCDPCLDVVIAASQRLRGLAALSIEVPAEVMQRAAVHSPRVSAESEGWLATTWWTGRAKRWSATLSPRHLAAPAAVVAAMCVIGMVHLLAPPAAVLRSTRGVPTVDVLRVTAARAALYAAPDPHAAPIAQVVRGTRVSILSEERNWYRVAAPGGVEGWLERDALE